LALLVQCIIPRLLESFALEMPGCVGLSQKMLAAPWKIRYEFVSLIEKHLLLMKRILSLFCCCSVTLLTNCTSFHHQKNTLEQAATMTDLHYGMVLDNIAMFRTSPGALPWHTGYTQGGVTTQQKLTPSMSYLLPAVSRTFGVSAEYSQQHFWQVVPELDPDALIRIAKVYERHAADEWIRDGSGPVGSYAGSHKRHKVWVDPRDAQRLTNVVIEVLRAANQGEKTAGKSKSGSKSQGNAKIYVAPSGPQTTL